MNKLDHLQLWERLLQSFSQEVKSEELELWLRPTEPLRVADQLLHLRVPNKFFSQWIKDHYQRRMEALLKDLSGEDLSLSFEVSKNLDAVITQEKKNSAPIVEALPQSDFPLSELNPRYTFSTFVVGPSNRFAHATAEAIAKNPGRQYNPFFLYGGAGLGKTHLLHAIGHSVRKEQPRMRVLYTTAEHFVNEYINSIKYDNPDSFRQKYRHLDCLLIDDIQFLIGKGRSEEEFFHTFNSLSDTHKQVVIASDRAPKEMAPEQQRLISRFEWGVVADMKPPDMETRIAILRKKAEQERLFIPDDVVVFIASVIKLNIRELEGALIRTSAYASLTGSPLTVDLARETLKDTLSLTEGASPVRVETVQKIVAEKYSLDMRDMKSANRSNHVAFPRQLAMYLTRELTDLSTPRIGEAFGGKDHTTVVHACKKIKQKIDTDPFFTETVNALMAKIKAVESQ